MRVDVFQAAAVCFQGNAFLRGAYGGHAPELLGPGLLTQEVTELSFYRTGNLAIDHGCIAQGTKSWFLKLRKEGVASLALALDLCQNGVVPRDPAGWGIVTTGDGGTEIWQPVWTSQLVRTNHASAYRISYTAVKHSPWSMRRPELAEAALARIRSLLHEVLQKCIDLDIASVFDEVRSARSGNSAGSNIAEEILGGRVDPTLRELVLTSVQCQLLIGAVDWQSALLQNDRDGDLAILTDRLWSAALRGFESCVAYGVLLSV
ncbi:MAG: hypothetical protein IT203_03845 [Fimbriimonadaceae bacterium]|nr:hypothetical protein [Fimbriimonadaceae bacterium]